VAIGHVLQEAVVVDRATGLNPYFRRTHVSNALSYCLAFDAPALGAAALHRRPITVKPGEL
jgi:hypothetical protein